MCDAIGHPVVRLRRVRIGPITDEHIRPGEFRDLTPREVALLRKASAGGSHSLPAKAASHEKRVIAKRVSGANEPPKPPARSALRRPRRSGA